VSIIDRLRAATGPDRELDLAVAMAINHRGMFDKQDWVPTGNDGEIGSPTGGILCSRTFVRPWTASIDVALTLVPEGAKWTTGSPHRSMIGTNGPNAAVWFPSTPDNEGDFTCDHDSPAIALCIAALQARGVK
jgi:hypothetical protein